MSHWNGRVLQCVSVLGTLALVLAAATADAAPESYQIFVSNERGGTVTVINGSDFSVAGNIAVGKRPRGIHGSPDGKSVYVALSGTPISAPPALDAQGNPILKKSKDDDEDDDKDSDKSADGIGVIDVASKSLKTKIHGGSDPEEFAVSTKGDQIWISNEDTKSATAINVATGKVDHIVPVGREPEGVSLTPDGKQVYITCESGGDIYVIDTSTYAVVTHFKVEGRPRSADFIPGGVGFVGSESAGQINVIDTTALKVLKVITLPKGSRPMRLHLSTDNKSLFVSNGRSGTISVIDTQSYELKDTITVGQRPWGIGISPDGKYLFSANGPSNDVSVVDLATNKEIKKIPAGNSPWGIAVVSIKH